MKDDGSHTHQKPSAIQVSKISPYESDHNATTRNGGLRVLGRPPQLCGGYREIPHLLSYIPSVNGTDSEISVLAPSPESDISEPLLGAPFARSAFIAVRLDFSTLPLCRARRQCYTACGLVDFRNLCLRCLHFPGSHGMPIFVFVGISGSFGDHQQARNCDAVNRNELEWGGFDLRTICQWSEFFGFCVRSDNLQVR